MFYYVLTNTYTNNGLNFGCGKGRSTDNFRLGIIKEWVTYEKPSILHMEGPGETHVQMNLQIYKLQL